MSDNLVVIFLRSSDDQIGASVSGLVQGLRDAGSQFVPSVIWRNVDSLTEQERQLLAQVGARVDLLFPDVYSDPTQAPPANIAPDQSWDG